LVWFLELVYVFGVFGVFVKIEKVARSHVYC
jgi:hypothetical protein